MHQMMVELRMNEEEIVYGFENIYNLTEDDAAKHIAQGSYNVLDDEQKEILQKLISVAHIDDVLFKDDTQLTTEERHMKKRIQEELDRREEAIINLRYRKLINQVENERLRKAIVRELKMTN